VSARDEGFVLPGVGRRAYNSLCRLQRMLRVDDRLDVPAVQDGAVKTGPVVAHNASLHQNSRAISNALGLLCPMGPAERALIDA